jgi:lysozyme family protein
LYESGFVKLPNGNISNLGITQKLYEAWMKKSVTEDHMQSLTPQMVAPIYKAKYWDLLQCEMLPHGVDLTVFDFAISVGQQRAIAKLQAAIDAYADGIMGPKTIEAVRKVEDTASLIVTYKLLRDEFYKTLPNYSHFGSAWDNRTAKTTEKALEMNSLLYYK